MSPLLCGYSAKYAKNLTRQGKQLYIYTLVNEIAICERTLTQQT